MAKIRNQFSTAAALFVVMALVFAIHGCQKAVTVPPKKDSGKETTATAKTDQSKADVPVSTAVPVQPKKTSSDKPAAEKPAPKQAADPLPKADIDCRDSKYLDGKSPRIQADGKPVTLLYYPPSLFNVTIVRGGNDQAVLTFGSITEGSADGHQLAEIHIAARPSDPQKGDYTRVALIYSDRIKEGQTYTSSAAGMEFKVEVLGNGAWSDSMFEGSKAGWVKLRITVK